MCISASVDHVKAILRLIWSTSDDRVFEIRIRSWRDYQKLPTIAGDNRSLKLYLTLLKKQMCSALFRAGLPEFETSCPQRLLIEGSSCGHSDLLLLAGVYSVLDLAAESTVYLVGIQGCLKFTTPQECV